jgi:diguanylate cyclase (GGDEF)-like protein
MTPLREQEFVVREPLAMEPPEALMGGIPHLMAPISPPQHRDRIGDGLARKILARLPLAVAVFNADTILSFWNERASLLFGAPPLMAAERPTLAQMLARVASLTQPQRDRIVAFTAAHIAAGDRAEPNGCLRLSLGRRRRIAVEVHGLGAGRWMVVFDDGKVTAAGNPAASGSTDAWLDSLTGLSNRRHYNDMLQAALDNATVDTSQAVMLIDLDGFTGVNETFGHTVGDALLCVVAQRIRQQLRDGDLLARLGGDEFALLLPNGDGAEPLAARLLVNISQPFLVEGQLVAVTASIGMVRFPDHGTSADDLMRHAHLALYQAKCAGGRSCRLFDADLASEARARRELETDLRRALTRGEIALAYRPCGDIPSHRLTGFEARLRWNHPSRGLAPDAVFLPLAEDTGVIVELNEWALNMACSAAVDWAAPLVVAIRISPRQLQDPDRLIASLQVALRRSGLAPQRLELRVAEAALLGRGDDMVPILHRLRTLGVGLSLVDFAIGPALLKRLRSFPFQAVAFDADNPVDVTGDADRVSMLCALSTAGLHHIGCYFGDSLTSAPGIAEVERLRAATGNKASAAESP